MNTSLLQTLRGDAIRFLRTRQSPGKPFGHFNQCAHAYADDELSALSVALELYAILGVEVPDSDVAYCLERLNGMQHPETGLLVDPSWKGRLNDDGQYMLHEGDSFFTRSAICALKAWDQHLALPIRYLEDLDTDTLAKRIIWGSGGHHRYSLGDLAVTLEHNVQLNIPGAKELQDAFLDQVKAKQDPDFGLWIREDPAYALTPSINFTFHTIKFTYNTRDLPLSHAERAIDSCLAACRDERYYSWDTGYACNDLDLALVLYSASRDTDYRQEEIGDWARERLPLILDIQKPDGGFSFHHDRAMERHCHLSVSPGEPEADLWGTLMYLGTVHMMTAMGYPGLGIPWNTSQVHKVRHA